MACSVMTGTEEEGGEEEMEVEELEHTEALVAAPVARSFRM